ncbi:MAG: putative reductase [Thermoleophilia bacterium]|nr:putative reductase [Thermoleophilia bacterium]
MRLLMLGGTGLSGTALVDAALERGHDVVAVHRGRSDTHAGREHPRLVEIVHDRTTGHDALASHGPFDAVVDVGIRMPSWASDAVRALDAPGTHWVQYSSVSAYADPAAPGPVESDALATFDDPDVERRATTQLDFPLDYAWYGAAKAAGERLLHDAVGDPPRVAIVRPGLITGPHDSTWRVPYWAERFARGGEALAPPPDDPVQLIDSRDLAAFVLDLVEGRVAGTFNAVSAAGEATVRDLLAAAAAAARGAGHEPATAVHVSEEFLAAHDVEPWSQLPAWLPERAGHAALVTADTTRARAAGLRTRPLTRTMADVLEWIETSQPKQLRTPPAGLDPARERELIDAWRRT